MSEVIHGRAAALSRRLAAAEVPPEGLEIEIVATESERAALAELNALSAILALSATLRARRWRGDGLEIAGEMRAKVRQNCVVTLEDFDSDIVEPIELRFAPPKEPPKAPSKRRSRRAEPEPAPEPAENDLMGEDPPDPLVGGAVDLGAAVSEFLTLGLDPYPRKPGAAFIEPASAKEEEDQAVVSPFARLRAVRGEPSANE
jgi:hypothetical protein